MATAPARRSGRRKWISSYTEEKAAARYGGTGGPRSDRPFHLRVHPAAHVDKRLAAGCAGTVPTASLPAASMAGTRAGESAIRPRSVSRIREPWSESDWRRPFPVSLRIREPGWSRDSAAASRSGSSWPPSPARPLLSRPRERAWSRRATRSLIGWVVVQANDAEMARDFLDPQVRAGHRQPRAACPSRRYARLDQSRTAAGPDRPQPRPEHRGPDPWPSARPW